jgi:hypothetical protein
MENQTRFYGYGYQIIIDDWRSLLKLWWKPLKHGKTPNHVWWIKSILKYKRFMEPLDGPCLYSSFNDGNERCTFYMKWFESPSVTPYQRCGFTSGFWNRCLEEKPTCSKSIELENVLVDNEHMYVKMMRSRMR